MRFELEVTATATINERWAVEIPDDVLEGERIDFATEQMHNGDAMFVSDEVAGDERDRVIVDLVGVERVPS